MKSMGILNRSREMPVEKPRKMCYSTSRMSGAALGGDSRQKYDSCVAMALLFGPFTIDSDELMEEKE